MSKAMEKEIKMEISLPQTGFPKTLYFNRLRVDRDDGFHLVQFGLVVASDLVDSYSCVLSQDALTNNKQALVDYAGKLVSTETGTAIWKGVTASRKADVADVVMMSFRGIFSETALYAYSMCSATRAAVNQPGEPVPSQPLVLLRSTTAFQKQLITALYIEE